MKKFNVRELPGLSDKDLLYELLPNLKVDSQLLGFIENGGKIYANFLVNIDTTRRGKSIEIKAFVFDREYTEEELDGWIYYHTLVRSGIVYNIHVKTEQL